MNMMLGVREGGGDLGGAGKRDEYNQRIIMKSPKNK